MTRDDSRTVAMPDDGPTVGPLSKNTTAIEKEVLDTGRDVGPSASATPDSAHGRSPGAVVGGNVTVMIDRVPGMITRRRRPGTACVFTSGCDKTA